MDSATTQGTNASVVIPVVDPDVRALALTLDSVAEQDFPIEEVVIVDGSDEPVEAKVDGIDTKVVQDEGLGQGNARRLGMQSTTGDYIVHLDEDAILLNENYVSEAVSRIESQPDAAAAGGTVIPLRGNLTGDFIAAADRLNPSTLGTHHLVHPRYICVEDDGMLCFPIDGRGEDITLRNALKKSGGIVRMYNQPAMKDLPTARQEKGINTLVLSLAGGVVSGLITSAVERAVRRYGERALESATAEVLE